MDSGFEVFEALDLQHGVDLVRKLLADAGHGCEQQFGVERPAQPVELAPTPGRQHYLQCRRDTLADARDLQKCVGAFAARKRTQVLWVRRDAVGRATIGAGSELIGALLLKQDRGLVEPPS